MGGRSTNRCGEVVAVVVVMVVAAMAAAVMVMAAGRWRHARIG